jgi:hypothetical protein
LQPAVSPICNRQRANHAGGCSIVHASRIANPRYSRLQVGATERRGIRMRTLYFGRFNNAGLERTAGIRFQRWTGADTPALLEPVLAIFSDELMRERKLKTKFSRISKMDGLQTEPPIGC